MSAVAERHDSGLESSVKQGQLKSLVLRGVVFKNGREYTAECIDLDILVYGKTPHEALQSLRDAVAGYLAIALSGDHAGLVPRPAPFSHRARYHLYALRAAFDIGLIGAKRNFLLSDCSPNLCGARHWPHYPTTSSDHILAVLNAVFPVVWPAERRR